MTLARQSRRQVKSCDRKQPRQHIDPIDGQSLGRRIDDFRNRDTTRRSIIRDLIPAHLVESRPVRGRRRIGKWGSLGQELNRKSRRLSIRHLVTAYSDILPDLAPQTTRGRCSSAGGADSATPPSNEEDLRPAEEADSSMPEVRGPATAALAALRFSQAAFEAAASSRS